MNRTRTVDLIILFARTSLHSLVGGMDGCCRFRPCCSSYAREAIHRFGIGRGLVLFFRRFTRCLPGGAFGLDPVPTTFGGSRGRW